MNSSSKLQITLWLSCLCAISAPTLAQDTLLFRAGAATSNVTPPLGLSIAGHMTDRIINHIHDELHARCLVLDDGRSKVAVAIVDSCMIPREIFDAAKEMASTTTDIPRENMLMAATHTHSAPCATPVFQSDPDSAYQQFLARRIADGVIRAHNNLEPAQIGWAAGEVPDEVFNRRWKMKAGAIGPNPLGETGERAMMNPPRASDNLLEPWGPVDTQVWVLALRSTAGHPIAILANYALHYVGGVPSNEVSADYFGAFAVNMTRLLDAYGQDPPFVPILSNGASGDINNINFREPSKRQESYEQINLVAQEVARETHLVYNTIDFQEYISLDAVQDELTLGVRLPNDHALERARAILASQEKGVLRSREAIYARESVLLNDYPAETPVILQAIRIGDLVIGAIPCEVFVEIGLELKADSPFKSTFVVELANGYNGYLPTSKQHALGGYETWRARSSYLDVDAASKIVDRLRQLFARLKAPH